MTENLGTKREVDWSPLEPDLYAFLSAQLPPRRGAYLWQVRMDTGSWKMWSVWFSAALPLGFAAAWSSVVLGAFGLWVLVTYWKMLRTVVAGWRNARLVPIAISELAPHVISPDVRTASTDVSLENGVITGSLAIKAHPTERWLSHFGRLEALAAVPPDYSPRQGIFLPVVAIRPPGGQAPPTEVVLPPPQSRWGENRVNTSILSLLALSIGLVSLFGWLHYSPLGSLCRNEVIEEVPSPDGTKKAVLFLRDCGATTAESPQLSILPIDQALPDDGGNVLTSQLRSSGGLPNWTWLDDHRLRVTLLPDTRVYRKEQRALDVSIEYQEIGK